MRPTRAILTERQKAAWEELHASFEAQDRYLVEYPAIYDAVKVGTNAMRVQANKLLENPAVKNAYDQFMLVCKLTAEQTHDNKR